jgi:hypothetical protein
MELLRDITLILHFLGLAIIIGPFVLRKAANSRVAVGWILAGGITQLVTGLVLTGLAEMRLADNPDMSLDHTKIAVKLVLTLAIFIVALIGYLKQRSSSGEAAPKSVTALMHSAGALAIVNVFIAVLWPGVIR